MVALINNLVLVDHPHFRDKHLIAKVVGQTSKMFQLQYWNLGHDEWREELFKRSQNCLIRVLYPEVDNLKPYQLSRFAQQLISLNAERDQRIKSVEAAYNQKLKQMEIR